MTKSSWSKFDSAYDAIVDTYDIETLNDIVNQGCVSGVAHSHIYTRDCVDFYNTFEDDLYDYIESSLGEDVLVDLFRSANCDIDSYKNNVTWCYIELIASEIVDTDNEELAS